MVKYGKSDKDSQIEVKSTIASVTETNKVKDIFDAVWKSSLIDLVKEIGTDAQKAFPGYAGFADVAALEAFRGDFPGLAAGTSKDLAVAGRQFSQVIASKHMGAALELSTGDIVLWGGKNLTSQHYDPLVVHPIGSHAVISGGGFMLHPAPEIPPEGPEDFVAVNNSGSLSTWGYDEFGQLREDIPISPASVAGGSDFTDVVVARFGDMAAAITSDHYLKAWGHQPLSNGDDNKLITDAPWRQGIAQLDIGAFHAHAVTNSYYPYGAGRLWGWGYEDFGSAISDTPQGNEYVMVACGQTFSVAIHIDGSLRVWGYPGGDIETDLPTGNDFVYVAAAGGWACAIRSTGQLVSWGNNRYHQVLDTPTNEPFLQVDCYTNWGVGLTADYKIKAWGLDRWGQISDAPQ